MLSNVEELNKLEGTITNSWFFTKKVILDGFMSVKVNDFLLVSLVAVYLTVHTGKVSDNNTNIR